jgi:DNA-binding transcriptional regulator YhcF (GntR family)
LRFWITKNSELSIREQLVRQVVLAILSEDLPAGHKLPSIRALARRCQVHSNTVSAAYHQLLEDGWLELRRGSGLYVRFPQPSETDGSRLDALLTRLLRESRIQGYAPEDVLQRLAHMVQPRLCVRIAIVEPDPGMREILQAELAQHLRVPIEAIGLPDHSTIPVPDACLAAALPGRAAMVRERLPAWRFFSGAAAALGARLTRNGDDAWAKRDCLGRFQVARVPSVCTRHADLSGARAGVSVRCRHRARRLAGTGPRRNSGNRRRRGRTQFTARLSVKGILRNSRYHHR